MTLAPDGTVDCGELLIAARAVVRAFYDSDDMENQFDQLPSYAFFALQGLREEVQGRRANSIEGL